MSFKSNKVKLMKIKENAIIPARATKGSAGLDLYACIEEPINLNAGESVLIPTGIAVELPNNEMAAFILQEAVWRLNMEFRCQMELALWTVIIEVKFA